MPELPEVEIAARQLARWCRGDVVRAVRVHAPRVVATTLRDLSRALRGRRLRAVSRRGKHILASLRADEGDETLWALHLGMSGKLVWRPEAAAAPAHTRVEIEWTAGRVCFVDPRKFGRMRAGDPASVEASLPPLGPDAWTELRSTTDLQAALGSRAGSIKVALLDQRRLAGLGNIQACEALFRARIHPRAEVSSLDRAAWVRLFRGIRTSLRATLAATEAEEVRYLSEGGGNPFRVYGRGGEACPRCATPIEAIRLSGRATFLCPRCQPA